MAERGRIENVNVTGIEPIITPGFAKEAIPNPDCGLIKDARQTIADIMRGNDPRKLFIAGPCSVDSIDTAVEYAQGFREIAAKYSDELFPMMRVYIEKPRTTVGWQGFLTDPYSEGVDNQEVGLILSRDILARVIEVGLPPATEFLDPITPHYFADLVAWGAIGARTTESQVHRKLASGLSMPVGFKNGTSGDIDVAVNAIEAGRAGHTFPGIDDEGRAAIIRTKGNPNLHIVLRGGTSGTNYDRATVDRAQRLINERFGIVNSVMIDCSHGNSNKDHGLQSVAAIDVARQVSDGQVGIMGIMLESNLIDGRQPWTVGGPKVRGQSMTDACVNLHTTQMIMEEFASTIRRAA